MPRSRFPFVQLTASFALLILAPALPAQEKDLPKAEEILDKYVEATGGKEAYEKLKNRVSKGSMEIVGQNLKGKIEVTQAAPNSQVTKLIFDAIGEAVQATNGELAWTMDPNTGDRVLDGEEKAGAVRDATFNMELNWRDQYKTAEAVGVEEIEGKPCYKVVLTPAEGEPLTQFYDKESGLLTLVRQINKSPQGEFEFEITQSDYRDVDGIKIAFASDMLITSAGVRLATRFDEVKHNVELPADTFAVPDAIKKLQESK